MNAEHIQVASSDKLLLHKRLLHDRSLMKKALIPRSHGNLSFFVHFGKSEVNDDSGFRVGWERLGANLGILCGESVGIGRGLWEFIVLSSGE